MAERRATPFLSIATGVDSIVLFERIGCLVAPGPDRTACTAIFSPLDTTAGSETELQAAVAGSKDAVDLPLTIEASNYLANIMRRTATGDMPRRTVVELERFLGDVRHTVWENSWVRFPKASLSACARQVMELDLLADKANRAAGIRSDAQRFNLDEGGVEFVRVPISYLIKLSLADAISSPGVHPVVFRTGLGLLDHFLSDNTSPETYSFHVVRGTKERGPGKGLARETAKRFLLTQLLVMYGNEKFHLVESGQKAMVYFSPHPPIRQRKLNSCISDSFYRELFMSPCLSGWDKGESKQDYMRLCHEVLSRSQLNAVAKLHDAGIITSNLVVLPNTSNISLANNGTHVSLGSTLLTRLRENGSAGFGVREEKYLGDLAIKAAEHFLPLFVGTYSAAPYRLDFADFHPERVLGFLPHELDYTHLRMLWRRWKSKANIGLFGRAVTPFGPPWLDGAISRLFRLRGDYIPDFRLIDYLVCLMSSETSPALNGVQGNTEALKKDLADLGIFDARMSLYLAFKLREFDQVGFCGLEGRYYSLFPGFEADMQPAVDLQNLVTALCFRMILEGRITHAHIPDSPFIESERRQIFFGAAIGIPTFFVRQDTGNRFLRCIVEKAENVRVSRRYAGYLRVHNVEYCRALLRLITEEAADLLELFDMGRSIDDLKSRLDSPGQYSAAARLNKEACRSLGVRSTLDATAEDFNTAAEAFYRNDLRLRHMSEAFDILEEDLGLLTSPASPHYRTVGRLAYGLLSSNDTGGYVREVRKAVMTETVSIEALGRLISAVLLTVRADRSSEPEFEMDERKTGT